MNFGKWEAQHNSLVLATDMPELGGRSSGKLLGFSSQSLRGSTRVYAYLACFAILVGRAEPMVQLY